MEKKKTGVLSGNSGTKALQWGETWLKRCLLLFLIAACLATTGWFFAGAGQTVQAAEVPVLTGYDIHPTTAYPGSTITFTYTINNPGSTPINVGLGATIRDTSLNYINDPDHGEIVVAASPGTATYSRTFRIPDTAMVGPYAIYWGIWDGSFGVQYQLAWRTDYLNIVVAPTVTLTFDDGYQSIYQNAYPVLNSYGYQATAFVITGLVGTQIPQLPGVPLMSVAELQALKAGGWEIGSHSVDHVELAQLSQSQIQSELSDSKNWIINNGLGPVYAFAYPFGGANGAIESMTTNYYKYARTTIEGINDYGPNSRILTAMLWGSDSYNSLYEVEQIITQAINQNKWAIVLCHGVVNDQNDPKLNSYYGWTTTNVLANLMAFLKNADVPVKTFAQMEGYTQTNRIPVAVNDSYSTNEDTALTVAAPGVLNNDTDADGNSLTAALVSNPAHGTLTLNSNGSFIYTPSTNYNGSDNFTYKANDGKANSNTATVAITVRAVNDAPVAVNDAYSVNEDTALTVAAPGVLNNDTDADGNSLTAALVTGPAHGTLNLSAKGSFTYTPNAGYSGADLFTYRASDGTTNSNTATVTITINQTGITATFGLDSGNYSGTEGSDMIDVMRFQNTAGTGTLTKLEILFNDTTPNGKVRLGVYADNNGVPGALLLDAGEVAVANGWVSIAGLNYSVTQGTYYWLAFGLQRDNGVTYQAGQPDRSHYWINYYYGALPSQYNLNGDRYGCNNGQFVIRATVPTANVNFKVVVTGVSGTDLSRTVTAQVTNTGSSDAHNAWAKIEVFSQSQRIQLSGQDYLSVNIGTVKAGATVTEQATLSFSLLDSLKIQQNGAQFLLTLYSDEWTQTLTYDYKP